MIEQITTFLEANQAAVLVTTVGAGLAYIYYSNIDSTAFESFEKTSLSEKVVQDLSYRVKKLGKETDKLITKDRDAVGNVRFYDTYEMPDDETIAPGTELSRLESTTEVYVFLEAPSKRGLMGTVDYYLWFFKDYLTENGETELMIVDKESVEKTRGEFILDPEIQFLPTTYSGVMVQNTTPSTNVVQQIATLDAEGEITNSLSEFLSKVEHFELEHLKKMDQLEKEGEIEEKRNEGIFRNS